MGRFGLLCAPCCGAAGSRDGSWPRRPVDVTVFLSLMAALSVGTSDFLGGLAARRADSRVVTAGSNLIGFGLVLVVALIVGGDVGARDLGWGLLGGAAVSFGLVALYLGYARARVSIAAPVAGVGAAALPVVVTTTFGDESLAGRAMVGVVIGLVSIALVSMGRSEGQGTVAASLLYGLGGAVGIGLLFLCLAETSEDSELWPIVAARLGGFAAIALVLLATRTPVVLPRVSITPVVGIAVLITAGNTLFLAATRNGSTAVAAVVTSLFPAVTVFWAWVACRERLRVVQMVGLGLALLAVALIAAA